jgi:hypothetical protein
VRLSTEQMLLNTLLWLVYPERQEGHEYRPDQPFLIYRIDQNRTDAIASVRSLLFRRPELPQQHRVKVASTYNDAHPPEFRR